MWGTPDLKKKMTYGSQSKLNFSFRILTLCQEPFQSADMVNSLTLAQQIARHCQADPWSAVIANLKEMGTKSNCASFASVSITRKFASSRVAVQLRSGLLP